MSRSLAAPLAAALMLGACVYTVDNAIPPGQASLDPALIGTWITGSDTAVVSAGTGGTYRIRYSGDDGQAVHFEGRAGRLGQRTILELIPLFGGDETGDWPVGKLLVVVSVSAGELTTQFPSADAVRAAIARDPVGMPHIRSGNDIILTAPTAQLVPALRAILDRPDALETPATWRRLVPRPPGGTREDDAPEARFDRRFPLRGQRLR